MVSMCGKERPRMNDEALSTGLAKSIRIMGLCEVTHRHNCSILNQYAMNIKSEIRNRTIGAICPLRYLSHPNEEVRQS